MSDLLDPAAQVRLGDLVEQLRMVLAHVVARPRHHLVVAVAEDDLAALAGDLLRHLAPFAHGAPVVRRPRWNYVGAALVETKVQLCGRLVVLSGGRRVEQDLPGRQGRLLLAYLALNRLRPVTRDEAVEALWPDGRDGGLAPLLSKLRHVVALEGLRPLVDWVDVEAATDAIHRAESALAQSDPHRAWGPAQVAMFISGRTFLAGEDAPWIDDERRRLAGLHLRALETYATASLGVGGTELAAAVRTGRRL